MFGKDRLKKKQFELSYFKFYLKDVQNAFKIFYKSLKKLVQKFATICIWKRSTFGFELELSLISKQNLKRKDLSWFQKCISKRSLPKWFERVENYLIWFNSPKVLFQKNLNMCLTSKENGNWKLTLFISKVVLKLIWFDFRNPKRVHSKWFENEVRMFHLFSKILKIPCLKQISKEPELICLLFIWDLIIKSSFQKSLKNKA